ncbi:Ketosteroid isomerase-related protein [Filimonas lacunae]|uniref:Ketosteroid isomerase-related protein n=1 Tax=Filimonas lacunae TaxID=477680 RepID=A0A173MHF8_9BACT|nr:nuclear transport factor 2 family protein [Filimonas lacunae]BAV06920.1 hypothetical protein FLA_2940 [Filimonas lacunae]SIS97813.1 Ketosteroid isomerase-related protein [Filimonas lacunae]
MSTPSQLLQDYLRFVSEGKAQQAFELFAEDGAIELPYLNSIGAPHRWAGKETLQAFFKGFPASFPNFHFKDIVIHIETDTQAFGEYHAEATRNGQPYQQHYMGRLVAENGKIKLLREALDMSQVINTAPKAK